MRETIATCAIRPMVVQTELHPRFPQTELVEYVRSECPGSAVMAHCPLAHGSPALLADSTLRALADARGDGCTPAMLCLRWSLDRGFIPIPKASSAKRIGENLRALRIAPLSAAERQAIDAIEAFGADARVSFDPALIA